MYISRTLFTFIVILTALIAALVSFIVYELIVSREKAELESEITELEEKTDALEMRLQLQEDDSTTDEQSGNNFD